MLVSAIHSVTTQKSDILPSNNLKKVQPSFKKTPDKNKYHYSDIASVGVIAVILIDYAIAYGNFQGDIVKSITNLFKMLAGLH